MSRSLFEAESLSPFERMILANGQLFPPRRRGWKLVRLALHLFGACCVMAVAFGAMVLLQG